MTRTTASRIRVGDAWLEGDLALPPHAVSVVLFAHGSGSSRHSPRNRLVAGALHRRGLATLLIDLLSSAEEVRDARTRELRFDIGLLAGRVTGALDWLAAEPETAAMPVGLFGASTGAAAALVAAAAQADRVRAVVSRGGRPDLAGAALARVSAPTLLLVGGRDVPVIELNEQARDAMPVRTELRIIPDATHLFEEPGALDRVAQEAGDWFATYLPRGTDR